MFNENLSKESFDLFSVFFWQYWPDSEVMVFFDFEKGPLFFHIQPPWVGNME
jgi:hypothetical protein